MQWQDAAVKINGYYLTNKSVTYFTILSEGKFNNLQKL